MEMKPYIPRTKTKKKNYDANAYWTIMPKEVNKKKENN